MADFEGIPLSFGDRFGGMLYRLAAPPTLTATFSIGAGLEVAIQEGVRAIVVRGHGHSDFDEAAAIGTDAANRGLDLLALRARPPLALSEVRDFQVVWWVDGDGLRRLRIVLAHIGRFIFSATGTVTGPDGEVLPPAVPSFGTWAPSMRYFRVAEASDDLFDSFRNIYLAIESLLSDIRPMGNIANGRRESEEVWFKAALREAAKLTEVGQFAPTPDGGDAIHAIWSELCDQLRNGLFHAKSARGPILPRSIPDTPRLLEAKQRYAALYLAVAGVVSTGSTLTPGGSFLSDYARGAMLNPTLADVEIGITGDFSAATNEDQELSPQGDSCAFSRASACLVAGYEEYRCIEAAFDREQLDLVGTIGRLGSVNSDRQLLIFDSLQGRLDLEGVDVVEVVLAQDVQGRPGTRDEYGS